MGLYTDLKTTAVLSVMSTIGKKKNKRLHIFLYEKFVDSFSEMIGECFGRNQDDIIVLGVPYNSGYTVKSLKYSNVYNVVDIAYINNSHFTNCALRYSAIYLHGLFEASLVSLFASSATLIRKTYVYLWGGDYESAIEKKNEIFKYLIQNCKGVITVTPTEQRIIKEKFGRYDNLLSSISGYSMRFEEYVPRKKVDGVFNIQVGNSAAPSNNHIAVLNTLLKYKDENIRIYAPLSYGDRKYAELVKKKGEELFGDKFVPIYDFKPLEEYKKLLKGMDVAFFGMKRQQALGNIHQHLLYGTKIYVYKDTILREILENDYGCKVWYIDNIDNTTFGALSEIDNETEKRNYDNMLDVFSHESIKKNWDKILR